MIKFFRHIRKTLIEKNNMGKYLKYAIGEILLVVIGILIALQINNWNTNRINQQKETSILFELKEEYLNKLDELNQKVSLRTIIINACGELFKYIEEDNINISQESITKYVAYTIIPPKFDASNSVTNELLNTGNLYLIHNKELRKLVTNWESELTKMTEEEQVVQTTLIHNYYPYITKKIPYKNLSIELLINNNDALQYIYKTNYGVESFNKSKFNINTAQLLNDIEFENQVASIQLTNLSANMQSENLHDYIDAVIQLIDQEIEKKNLK